MKLKSAICALTGVFMLSACMTTSGMNTALVGKAWIVEDIGDRGVIDDARATLLFGHDGRVAGDTSCNRYFADYEIDGQTLKIGYAGVTKRACAPAVMNQEQRFLEVLNAVDSFRIDPTGALILSTPAGETITARTDMPPK